MQQPIPNVRVETRGASAATVVIEVPLEDGDSDDHVVLAKAWAILAERITIEKRDHAEDATTPAEDVPAAPGNAAWWGG